MRLAATLLCAALAASAADAGRPFSREMRACATCHPAESKPHPLTPMAHAAETVAECGVLSSHPRLVRTLGKYSYTIERQGDRSIYKVSDGVDEIVVPVKYAMGLGAAGQTYIFEKDGKYFESYVSYYKALDGLDITIGDRPNPSNLVDAAGRALGAAATAECFNCHATDSVRKERLVEESFIPGVQCEACHGATADHLAGVGTGDARSAAMKHLGGMTAEASAQFCGQCHRTWEYIATHGPHNTGNVRFQPYRLTLSRCFDADDRRIACTACHNPHQSVETAAARYDANCQACHAAGGKSGAKLCKVAAKDCSSCHMPKIELPGSHHKFTDHNIRIVAQGAYPD
ncbi:MAG TPA: multiheme c-type cytochrome [Bryobacteraceae bacterium]|nr:multiheme c-type cytochrome [Bryobacteraceae bacterium]